MDPTVSTSADGVVHITAEYELPQEDEQPEPAAPQGDPVADVLGGLAHAAGTVLSGLWRAIRPDDSQQPPETEEE